MELKQFIISGLIFLAICYLFLSSGYGVGKLFLGGFASCKWSFGLIWGACFIAGIGASIK